MLSADCADRKQRTRKGLEQERLAQDHDVRVTQRASTRTEPALLTKVCQQHASEHRHQPKAIHPERAQCPSPFS